MLTQSDISVCSCEEADPRLVRHALNQAKNGYDDITIRNVDSDVVVLSLSYVDQIMEAGAKSVFTQLEKRGGAEEHNLIELYNQFGSEICHSLTFFHAFSGCDTTSSFYGKGKTTFWDVWMTFSKHSALTQTFIQLSNTPEFVNEENINLLEEIMLYLYFGKDHGYSSINDARCKSFFRSPDPNLRETILSKEALLEHIKRSTYQAGWMWRECERNIVLPDPALWGWKTFSEQFSRYFPRWQENESVTNIFEVLATCGCKTSICKNCKCRSMGEKCLDFCKCKRKCKNV